MPVQLAIVVPCFNEQDALPETNRRLLDLLSSLCGKQLITPSSSVHYVDDGSSDRTWSLVESLAAADSRVHGIKLSRNRGHQFAVLAGLLTVEGDAIVSIDADLQDDVAVIESMVIEFERGAEVVYGVRESRQTDSVFKRSTARMYYGLMKRMGVDLVHDHADFRLLGRRAVDALRQYGEVNVFLRGIVPLIGYRAVTVRYDRSQRIAGVSKYPLRRMLSFALEGITSFSIVPLRLITLLGFMVSAFSFLMILFIIYGTLAMKAVVPGWASSVVPIYFLGGIQLLSTGILGEYVAKIYMETKRRPRYIVERMI
jgi:glycosyltransferase involved in cell wall biosynthesis